MSSAGYPLTPDPRQEWSGAKRRYDIVKEGVVALAAVGLLVVVFALLFSSPDEKPVTVQSWAQAAPQDFLTTALAELDGTSGLAGYGPPYTDVPGAGQNLIGHLSLARLVGVRIPIDPANAFVLGPLSIPAQSSPKLALALAAYRRAGPAARQRWAAAYAKELGGARVLRGAPAGRAPVARDGPLGAMMAELLAMAQSGALDGALISTSRFYQTDFTKALLLLADGSYLSSLAAKEHLLGTQWGMMNETGNYPGQAWLWLYTFWYQIPPFTTSSNADAQIWALMAILSLVFVCIPLIPGLRSLPRFLGVHRLIWHDYYRIAEAGPPRRAPEPATVVRQGRGGAPPG